MVAVEFGLIDVLKHLVEEVGIDVNAFGLTCYSEVLKIYLLAITSRNNVDPSVFRYVLARPEIDVTLSVYPPNRTKKSILIHAIESEHVNGSTLEALVLHPSCKPNEPQTWVNTTILPLQYLLLHLANY